MSPSSVQIAVVGRHYNQHFSVLNLRSLILFASFNYIFLLLHYFKCLFIAWVL